MGPIEEANPNSWLREWDGKNEVQKGENIDHNAPSEEPLTVNVMDCYNEVRFTVARAGKKHARTEKACHWTVQPVSSLRTHERRVFAIALRGSLILAAGYTRPENINRTKLTTKVSPYIIQR